VGIAAIVLGPWSSMLAISLALTIQALFFGDGGITTLGANCFNMAIAGSLVAWGTYRLVSHGAKPSSRRRVWAAGLAGYAAVNVSALLAAVELGVQPMWFHDAAGAPLYAPYPLHIAVPAMMLGHLTIAGAAEAALSAGLLRYLERNEPSLSPAPAGSARGLGPALALLLLLVLLTPLGILAGGAAWGEWAPQDFSSPSGTAQIAAASGQAAPPAEAPAGLERLAGLWTAPLPQYAPQFVRSVAFGYLISAMIGAGAILAVGWLARRLTGAVRTAARTGETR